jgi:hypothetical protein
MGIRTTQGGLEALDVETNHIPVAFEFLQPSSNWPEVAMNKSWRTYNEYQQRWEREREHRRLGHRRLARHPTTGSAFVRELELLWELTSDERFQSALNALRELSLINEDSSWNKEIRSKAKAQARDEDSLAWFVEKMVSEDGMPVRVACARAVVYSFGGLDDCSSFDAAVKMVDQLWRTRYRSKLEFGS